MEESLKKNKKDFWKQLKNVKEKLKSESSDELYQDRKELEEKHKKLREKIIDTKDRLDTLDNKKMRSGHQNHCCAELYTKTKDWENQINAARNETIEKSNQFESQLKDMEIMLYALKNRVKSAKNTLETQGEAVENELESCEQVFEKLTKTPNNNHICCENCLDKLLDRLKELEESVKSLLNKLDSVKSNNCQENNNRMAKIKDLTDQLDNLKSDNASVIKMKSALPNANPNARIHKLEQEVQNLQQAANDSQICCDKIPKINTFVEHLQSKIKQMQQSNPEILKQNKLELEDLKKQFNETLADMKNKQKELEKLKDLQAMLEKVKSELKVQEDELNELINKKNKNNVTDDGENTVQELDQFWVKVDTQLSDLEGQSLNETNQYSLLDDLQKSLDKAKLRLEDIRQHEKQDNVEEDKLKELENQLALCLDACKVVSRMHELFKNVNNIIQVIKYTSKLRVATTDKVSNILKIPSKPTPAAKKIIPKKPAPKTKKG
ncbi:putative leucine-rich repeat-containing protein DDB_G0290503 isoform X2 [Drosophila kikkawai]